MGVVLDILKFPLYPKVPHSLEHIIVAPYILHSIYSKARVHLKLINSLINF